MQNVIKIIKAVLAEIDNPSKPYAGIAIEQNPYR
jgi:hypothetical protein